MSTRRGSSRGGWRNGGRPFGSFGKVRGFDIHVWKPAPSASSVRRFSVQESERSARSSLSASEQDSSEFSEKKVRRRLEVDQVIAMLCRKTKNAITIVMRGRN